MERYKKRSGSVRLKVSSRIIYVVTWTAYELMLNEQKVVIRKFDFESEIERIFSIKNFVIPFNNEW